MIKSLVLLAIVLMTACVSQQFPQSSPKNLDELKDWEARGKLSIVDTRQARSVNFSWKNDHTLFDIRLYGALGLGTARLVKESEGNILLSTSGGQVRASTAEAIMQETLGWSLPVSDLEHWIKGIDSPNAPTLISDRDQTGLLLHLNEQGWAIDYLSYHHFEHISLPRKIVASREGLKLTMVIKNWRF